MEEFDEANVEDALNKDGDDNLAKRENEDNEDDSDNDYKMDENDDDEAKWSDVKTLEKCLMEKALRGKVSRKTTEGKYRKEKKKDSVNYQK